METLYVTGGLIEFQQLLAHNATVYLAARSAQKANEAIAELKSETGKQAIFLQLDLSDLHAVRKSAQEFLSYVFCMFVFQRSRRNLCFSGKRSICMSLLIMRESGVGFQAATADWL